VATLWQKSWKDYKSPLRVVVQSLLRSRDGRTRKCKELTLKLRVTEQRLAQSELAGKRQVQEIRQLKERVRHLEAEKQQATCRLPADPPIGTHGYGARMICLSVNLAKIVGLRPASRVLKIIFDWLEVEQKVPCATAKAVSVRDVKQWVEKNLGTTLTSKRRATYSEFKSNTKSATIMISTA